MADEQEKQQRPPYASAADLTKLFERIGTIGDPGNVDTKWVVSYKLAASQPEAIVSVLKWLKVIDHKGKSLGVWNDVRVAASRQKKLAELVRAAYDAVFERIDVEQAGLEDLQGTFIQAYGSGDPARHVTCFLALCAHAGISTKVKARPVARRFVKEPDAAAPRQSSAPPLQHGSVSSTKASMGSSGRDGPNWQTPPVTISLNVEIPAEWSEQQIRERLSSVRRASEEKPSN
jgi:hypothetical protein